MTNPGAEGGTGGAYQGMSRGLGAGLLVLFSLSGCASQQALSTREANDPFERVNRVFYDFNAAGDKYLLRPVAAGYRWVLPQPIRTGVRNVFSNLLYPVTIANAFLQGKFRQTGRDGARFLVNSTVGVLGIFDPATPMGLVENNEDFDQTLANWGLREGPYLVIPVLGPFTTRGLVGDAVDAPLTPFVGVVDGEFNAALGAWFIYQVDKRSTLLDADEAVFTAFDPYIFVRDAYLQNRRFRELDGNVPEDDYDLDDEDPLPDDGTEADGGNTP